MTNISSPKPPRHSTAYRVHPDLTVEFVWPTRRGEILLGGPNTDDRNGR